MMGFLDLIFSKVGLSIGAIILILYMFSEGCDDNEYNKYNFDNSLLKTKSAMVDVLMIIDIQEIFIL